MIKFKCNKLSRDKSLEDMKNAGIVTHYRILETEDFQHALKEKLIEESAEVQHAISRDEIVAELADLLEIVDELAKAYKISLQEIRSFKTAARLKRGGYQKRIFMEAIEMDENNQWVKHFRKSPKKYPEI